MDIELDWTEPKRVNTKYGEKMLRKAPPTGEFWSLWRSDKGQLKNDGYSVTKDDETGDWLVMHWGELPKEELQAREENRELSRATDADLEVPAPDGLEYLPYQRAGIAFGLDKDGILIGDEMGLGKTIQAIGIINAAEKKANSILVVCPASLRLNWKKEMNRWLVEDYSIGVVDRSDYPEDTEIVIINYDVLVKHKEKLYNREWDYLIVDEAHYVKNPKAQRTQALLGKGKKDGIPAGKKIFLTGTPIVNRPSELFSVISALDPQTWTSFWRYAQRYCDAKQIRGYWDFSGASNLEELQDKLRSTIMVRRLKKDVLTELPPKIRQVIEIPASASEKRLIAQEREAYEQKEEIIAELRAAVELAKASPNKEDYQQAVQNLREGISGTFEELARLRYEVAMAKVPYVVEHISNTEEKVVVFAHHKDVVDALMEKFGDTAVKIDGRVSMEKRDEAVTRFQNDPSVKIFVGSIHAAGVGLTLTAASHVVFAELDWVPGNLSQAEDRCHRIGQNDSVLVQHLVLEESLDAYMAQTIIAKQRVIDTALDEEYELENFAVPEKDSTYFGTREKIQEESEDFTQEEIDELHRQIKYLASLDQDRALVQNNMGFNKVDSRIGHSLAQFPFLSPAQAVIAKKLAHKYRRQLDS